MNLFDYYPHLAGFKERDTSRAAAKIIDASTPMLRDRILFELQHGPATADEMADRLGVSILSVRPRFSELRKRGKIEDTGLRHRNESGCLAKVWRRASSQEEGKTP